VETDIANCFSAIPHDQLMQAIEERVWDRAVLALIRTLLRAGVMEGGSLRRSASGTPQGSLCSAEHNPPYEQCRVMRSAGLLALVTAMLALGHCA
jgi:retron-type reverse transcriptase